MITIIILRGYARPHRRMSRGPFYLTRKSAGPRGKRVEINEFFFFLSLNFFHHESSSITLTSTRVDRVRKNRCHTHRQTRRAFYPRHTAIAPAYRVGVYAYYRHLLRCGLVQLRSSSTRTTNKTNNKHFRRETSEENILTSSCLTSCPEFYNARFYTRTSRVPGIR